MKSRVLEISIYFFVACLVIALRSGLFGTEFSRFQIVSGFVLIFLLILAVLLANSKRADNVAKHKIRALVLVEVEARLSAHTLENYGKKFQNDLIGTWSHAVGTFSQVRDEIWTFHADGKGEIVVLGPFGAERERAEFRWQCAGNFALNLRMTREFWDDGSEEESQNAEEWQTVRYEFRLHSTDCGEFPALFEVDREGFWWSEKPLAPRIVTPLPTSVAETGFARSEKTSSILARKAI